jgi:hypothetical protein
MGKMSGAKSLRAMIFVIDNQKIGEFGSKRAFILRGPYFLTKVNDKT